MFKAMILLKRREDNSIQDFRSWWIGEHAPLARQLPGVRRICFNVVESEEALYDGVSELWLIPKKILKPPTRLKSARGLLLTRWRMSVEGTGCLSRKTSWNLMHE